MAFCTRTKSILVILERGERIFTFTYVLSIQYTFLINFFINNTTCWVSRILNLLKKKEKKFTQIPTLTKVNDMR